MANNSGIYTKPPPQKNSKGRWFWRKAQKVLGLGQTHPPTKILSNIVKDIIKQLITDTRRLNMELDLQSLFGLQPHVTWCEQLYSLAAPETPQPPFLPPHWDSYTRALLVSQDIRHLLVTPCPRHIHKEVIGCRLLNKSGLQSLLRFR